MKRFFADRKELAIFVLAGLVLIFFLDYLGVYKGTDNYFYDLSFRLRGPRAPDSRIVIVTIDEKTLAELGRWPFPRRHYATLLQATSRAAAVGLDLILDEPSDEDPLLSRAIQQHGRVVLPVYFDQESNPRYPLLIFAPHRTGHIHVEPGVDGVLRETFHTLYKGHTRIPSFSSEIYETMTGEVLPRQTLPAVTSAPDTGKTIFQMDYTRINFCGTPGTFPQISLADVLSGKYPSSSFEGKAILAGVSAPGLGDIFMTPFSQNRNRMTGVEVHANLLDNLLKRSGIRVVNDWLRRIFGIILFFPLFVLLAKTSYRKVGLLWLTGCIVIVCGSFLFFTVFRLWLRPTAYFLSLGFVFAVAHVYRLDEAVRKLSVKYLSIASLVGGKEIKPAHGRAGLGLPSFLSTEGVNAHIQRLLTVEQQYEEKLQKVIDEKTRELSNALLLLRNMSREVVLRLTAAGEFRDSDTGKHITRIRLYAHRISEAMGMSHEFIDEITFSSAMHDIGKIGIPDHILQKPGSLTPEEFEIMKTHTLIGEKILAGSKYPMIQLSAGIALSHHEKWDGTGYPYGIKGNGIPLQARIVMICDIYDALRSHRPYKPGFDHQTAFKIITEGDRKTSPKQFDPEILGVFIKIADVFEGVFRNYRD